MSSQMSDMMGGKIPIIHIPTCLDNIFKSPNFQNSGQLHLGVILIQFHLVSAPHVDHQYTVIPWATLQCSWVPHLQWATQAKQNVKYQSKGHPRNSTPVTGPRR